MALTPGTRLGVYEVTAQIGEGGMGQVYRATDTTLGRQVAIKILPNAFASDPERLGRFEREAKTLASLNHPNIATIYGFEKSAGMHALVMELVEGDDLSQRLARGTIPVDEALPIAKQIAEALEAAHEQGIIHRDLKPSNIKLRPDGTVKVLDFGLAKALEPTGVMASGLSQSPTITEPAMTQAGVILGTAAYMSPEQARGKAVDKRTDIWAFGCVLYEMLIGRRAFDGEDVADTIGAVIHKEPVWSALPPSTSPTLCAVLQRCLQKDPKQRARDIGDVLLALDGAFGAAAPASPVSPESSRQPPFWMRAVPVAAAAVIASIATALGARLFTPSPPSPTVKRFEYELQSGEAFRLGGTALVAISRDGRHFVYNTNRGLYLRSLDAIEPRVIPGTETAVLAPAFSPDGETIAFVQDRALKRLSIRGGAARQILGVETLGDVVAFPSLSWNTDGTILIGHGLGISRVAADGSTPELLVRAQPGEQMYGPRLLPGGDGVLFTTTTAVGATRWDQADIVVQSLSTGQRTTLVRGGSDARYIPTGHLVYAVADTLFAVAFDIERLQVRGSAVPVLEGVGRGGAPQLGPGATFHEVSADGTLVYARAGGVDGFLGFANNDQNTLVWVDRQGREDPVGAAPRRYLYPRLSPDGTRLAVDARDRGQDVWIWDLRRQNLAALTSDPALDGLPAWTPDSTRLVWMSTRVGGALNLYWQRADGTGTIERLTESGAQRPNSFTPDGKHLVFSIQGAGRQDIAMLSMEGTREVTTLVQGAPEVQNGEVSPDGRWLAYESNESGRFEVYVRPFPSVDSGRVTVSTAGGRQPAWSRDGRELFYIAADRTLMAVTVEARAVSSAFVAGTPTKLHEGTAYYDAENTPNRGRTYDVSPDGKRFLRIKQDTSQTSARRGSLVVVVNWLEELKRLVPTN